MACEELLAGCFFDENAPMVVPDLNRERTLKYTECCYRQGLSWEDVEQQIEEFFQRKGVTADFSVEITTTVLWLNKRGLDITCIRLKPYLHSRCRFKSGSGECSDAQALQPPSRAGVLRV